MLNFGLKILQKCGYLNTRFALINSESDRIAEKLQKEKENLYDK